MSGTQQDRKFMKQHLGNGRVFRQHVTFTFLDRYLMLVKVVKNSRGSFLCSEEEAILHFLLVYFTLRENLILEVTIISSVIQPAILLWSSKYFAEMCFIVSQGKHRWDENTKAHTHTHELT